MRDFTSPTVGESPFPLEEPSCGKVQHCVTGGELLVLYTVAVLISFPRLRPKEGHGRAIDRLHGPTGSRSNASSARGKSRTSPPQYFPDCLSSGIGSVSGLGEDAPGSARKECGFGEVPGVPR